MRRQWSWLLALLMTPPLCSHAAESVVLLDFEPWVVDSGSGVGPGFLVELTARAFAGDDIDSIRLPTRRLLAEAGAGSYDWLYMPCHIQLPQHQLVSEIARFEMGVLVLAKEELRNWQQLRGKSVAIWTARYGNNPKLAQEESINKVEINSLDSSVSMLRESRVAGVVATSHVISWQLSQMNLDPAEFRFLPIEAIGGCLFANKTMSALRRDTVQTRIEALVADGTIASLFNRYRGVDLPR